MAKNKAVYEGDTIKLFCDKAEGFVYALSSQYSCVTTAPQSASLNVHYVSFQVWPENYDVKTSPLEFPQQKQDFPHQSLVYGRKVKLLHVASNMYLSLGSSSDTSKNGLNVKLEEKFENNTCVFCILSTNKHIGEDVLSLDEIKLKSVSSKGHHVLVAFNPCTSRYELKAAVTHSIFVISSSQSRNESNDIKHKTMRDGDVVLLFNYESEGYLAGHEKYDKAERTTEVGARQKKLAHGMQKPPPLSGDCFWQLEEVDKAQLNGDQFKYHCRIKHVQTGQYLSVDVDEEHVSLRKLETNMPKNFQTQFELFLVLGVYENECLCRGSYVEIRCECDKSKKKLSVLTTSNTNQCKPAFGRESPWLKVGLQDSDQSSQQYFQIKEVDPDVIHQYYYMSGVTIVLQEHLRKFAAGSTLPSHKLLEVLEHLENWLSDKEIERARRANMLRVSQGVELLTDLYNLSKEYNNLKKEVSKILQAFLDPELGPDIKKNHRYFANHRFLNNLFRQIGQEVDVEEVLCKLIGFESSVTTVVNVFIEEKVLDDIGNKLDANILKFLSTLCFTIEKRNQFLQDKIYDKIIIDAKDCLMLTDEGFDCFTSPQEICNCPVSDIFSKENYSANKKHCEFFIAQLQLFSQISKNPKYIEKIKELHVVKFDAAFKVIDKCDLHPSLRSAYFDFIVSVYVDRVIEESGTDTDNIWHTFNWDTLCSRPIETADGIDKLDGIDDVNKVKSSIEDSLYDDHKGKVFSEDHIELLLKKLSILERLISYGFYEYTNKNEIANYLICIIKEKTYSNEKKKEVLCVKEKAVQNLHTLFKELVYIALGEILNDFKKLYKKDFPDDPQSLAQLLRHCELNEQLINTARNRLRDIFRHDDYKHFDVTKDDGKVLAKSLTDLMKQGDDNLTLSSALLLFDIYQKENILFHDAELSYVYSTTYDYSVLMKNYACFTDNSKVLLRLLQGQAIEINDEVTYFLNATRSKCMIGGDETQPHNCYQRIVFSSGVFSAIYRYIQLYYSTGLDSTGTEQVSLMKSSCSCLQAIARRNNQIQKKLFLSFIDFIDAKIAKKALFCLMTETLSGNHLLCHKLSEDTIIRLYMVAATSSEVDYYEFFITLETIMKPYKWSKLINGMPLLMKNYQELIAKAILEHNREQFYSLLFKSAQGERLAALKHTDVYKLLAVSDLLASVAEGPCQYAEDMCQEIFSLDDLVNIISDPDIKFDRRKPFARILNEGYINTERESLASIAKLSKISAFWDHLKECAKLVEMMHNKLLLNHIEIKKVKIEVRILFSQHSSINALEERSEEFNDTLDYNEKSILVSSLLCYLIDGLIPLVTSICSQLHVANTSSDLPYSSLLTAPNVTVQNSLTGPAPFLAQPDYVLKEFVDSVVVLANSHPEVFLTMPEMTQYWTRFIDSVANMLPIDQKNQLNEVNIRIKEIEEFYISSDLRHLKEEKERNDAFQTFIKNYKTVYERYIAKTSQKHSHHKDICPTSFQELIKHFSDIDKADTKKADTDKAKKLLECLDVSYKQLQKPLLSVKRTNINFVVLTSLQVLCGLVHSRIDGSDSQSNVQKELLKWESHHKVIVHLANPKNEIAIEVFAFFQALLDNHNEEAQKSIGDAISTDRNFFVRLNQLIKGVIASLGHRPTESGGRDKGQTDQQFKEEMSGEVKETNLGGHSLPIDRAVEQLETSEPDAIERSCIVVLNVVSDLCNGQNYEMQNLFREQEDAFFNVNVVRLVAVLFQTLVENFTEKTISSVKKAIQALIEACAGNFKNQEVAFKCQIIYSINIILLMECKNQTQKTPEAHTQLSEVVVEEPNKYSNTTGQGIASKKDLTWNELMEVKASAIELLEVILEETNKNSETIIRGIAQDLSMKGLISTINEFWEKYNNKGGEKNEARRAMFRAHHVVMKIADCMCVSVEDYYKANEENKENEENEENDPTLHTHNQKCFRFPYTIETKCDHKDKMDMLRDHTRCIEVNYVTKNKDEILTKVYFPFSHQTELTKTEKNIIQNNIKRDSPEEKVKDLLKWMKPIRQNFKHREMIEQNWYLHWAIAASGLRNFLLIVLTLLLNLFVVVLFDIPDERNNTTADYMTLDGPVAASWFSDYFIFILGIFHLILSIWMVSEYFVREAPNILFGPFYHGLIIDYGKRTFRCILKLRKESESSATFTSFDDDRHVLKLRKGSEAPDNLFDDDRRLEHFQVYFFNFRPLYRIVFLICSIVALGTEGYFYCGCILYVFLNSNVLQQVLTAIWRSASQLISVTLLALGILLIFAVISFVFLYDFFDNDTVFCHTMFECYISIIREGLLDTIGTMLPVKYIGQTEPSFTIYAVKSIFDLAFFIIITTLGLNIVVAILVDRFSELRSEREKVNDDKLNYCLVCGIDNDTFERKGKGFRNHVLNDHNMWNYVYYMLYLDYKDRNDHNAIEKYVYDCIHSKDNKIDFFPLRQAKVLGERLNEQKS